MRTVVTDVLGKCRVIDAWNNQVLIEIGGNEENISDRSWEIGSSYLLDNEKVFAIHKSGNVSFFNIITGKRESIINLGIPSNSFSLQRFSNNFITCFNGYISIFNEEKYISSFETCNGSCANSFHNIAVYGKIEDRTVAYDINTEKIIWTASEPPKDELKISLPDKDRSILFLNENLFAVGQSEGKIILYDLRSGPTSIFRYNCFVEFPVVAMSLLNDSSIICGDTVGSIMINDLKIPENILLPKRGFKGSTGGISSFSSNNNLSLITSLSFDRTIRIYDYSKPQKVPLKIAFTKTLGTTIHLLDDELPNDDSSENEWAALPEDSNDVWEKFIPCPQSKTANK